MRWERFLVLGLLVASPFVAHVAAGRAGPAAGADGRVDEAIVLSGEQLAVFQGAAWDELWVYVWAAGDWQFVVGQLDDRDQAGQYVAGDGTGLDANDEYLFMADVLGEEKPAGAWPPNLDRAYPSVEVRVTDPLDPGFVGRAYVFRSAAAPYPLVRPRVSFDAATLELSSEHYVVAFADPRLDKDAYIGLKRLSLNGQPRNVIDRLKIRADVTFQGSRSTVTEEGLSAFTGDLFRPAPVKMGLLRAVLDPAGAGLAYPRRVTLFGGLERLAGVQPPIGQVELHGLRVSLDLAPELGAVTYSDANIPAGVPVDGSPDTVPAAPLPDWRQIAVAEGRAVLLRSQPGRPSGATVYYKDDKAQDVDDTGDYASYGDNGAVGTTVEDWASAGFPGEMVVLAADDPRPAAGLVAQKGSPLTVTVTVGEWPPTPSPGAATATSAPVTATPTRTVGPARRHIHLPWARK